MVAIVRVITSPRSRTLLHLPNVTVVVADSRHDKEAIALAIKDCDRVFLVTKFWTKFDGFLEESQVRTVFGACRTAGVHHVVFSTFEDMRNLRERGTKSQIISKDGGKIDPDFKEMEEILDYGASLGIVVTHMMTSYLDQVRF